MGKPAEGGWSGRIHWRVEGRLTSYLCASDSITFATTRACLPEIAVMHCRNIRMLSLPAAILSQVFQSLALER